MIYTLVEIIEEVDAKEIAKTPSSTKSLKEGLIEFVKMGEQKTIPIHTRFGVLYIRKPTFEDEIEAIKLRREYDGLEEKDWKQIKSVLLTSRLIVEPEISFEELIKQPTDIFIEIAQKITEKLPEISLKAEDEDTKKK